MSLAMVFCRLAEGVDFSAIEAFYGEPMNIRRSRIRYRVNRVRRRRLFDFDRYNPQMALPFEQSFAPRETLDRTRRDREDAEFGL